MRKRILFAAALLAAAPGAAHAQAGDTVRTPERFWASLGDTTLSRLLAEAVGENRDLRAVAARVTAARANRTGTALGLAPVVTASSGYLRQRLASGGVGGGSLPDQELWDAGVQMSLELDVFGRTRGALRGQSALIASAEEDVQDLRVAVGAEVARAYFDLRGAEDRLGVARQNAENQRRSLAVTRERLEAGRGTALDTERAQAQLSSTLAVIPSLEAQVAAARHRIGVLLGRSPAGVVVGSASLGTLPEPPAAAVDEVVRARPDVRAAERQLAARSAFVSSARAEYLPRVAITGHAGYTAAAFDAIGERGTPRYAVGPVISWPLFDLGRVRARVAEARAGQSEAAARYEQAVLRAQEEVETARVGYQKARERLAFLEQAAVASERATELARLRYQEGATGFLEVLDAERTLLEAQDRLSSGRTEAFYGLVAVYRALGGAWSN